MDNSSLAIKAAKEIDAFLLLNDTSGIKEFLNSLFKDFCSFPAVKKDYGGTGGSFEDIYNFNKVLAYETGNLGFSVSILINQIILRFISDYGTDEQKSIYLKKAISSGSVFSFAVSEPGHGPHPKFLETKATENNDHFILEGIKTFITNGPVSDFSLVIAITDQKDKKYYSCFIIPTNQEKIEIEAIENLPFFKNSPHGTIKFNSVYMEKDSIIGERGTAYQDIVMTFRKYEDILMAAPVLGSLKHLLKYIHNKTDFTTCDKELMFEIGRLKAYVESIDFLCLKTCRELEKKNSVTDYVHLFFREEIKTIVERFLNICQKFHIDPGEKEAELLKDLKSSGEIAYKAAYNKMVKLSQRTESDV